MTEISLEPVDRAAATLTRLLGPSAGVEVLFGELFLDLDAAAARRLRIDGRRARPGRRLLIGGERLRWGSRRIRLARAQASETGIHESTRSALRRLLGGDLGVLPRTLPTLLQLEGRHAGRRWPLPVGEHLVGRSARCTVVVDDESVSRIHAELRVRPSGVEVRDRGSRHGTRAAGRRCSRWRRLRPGATLQVGLTRLVLDGPARTPPLEPDRWLWLGASLLLGVGGVVATAALLG